jgi:predicted DNA-binding transcriptional regulator AlpA
MTDQSMQPILDVPTDWAVEISTQALSAPVLNAVEGWISAKAVKEAFGISDMTLWRWIGDAAIGFPKPAKIGNRRFFSSRLIAEWQSARMADAQCTKLA